MASELRVTTIANNAGSESVDTTYVVNGSAKAWQESVTSGTQTVNDSLNVSSITDNGTGLSSLAWTNSFGSANYSFPMTRSGTGNPGDGLHFPMEAYAISSSSLSFSTKIATTSSISYSDAGYASSSHHGDLA